MRAIACLILALCPLAAPAIAATLTFTLTASEPVTVTGSPRLAIDVGGVTRYATYLSGTGTPSLSFSYAVQLGDFDANGIALVSPLQPNGGTITDVARNPVANLAFTLPDISALKIQTYTAAFTTSPITNANATAVGFTIAKAPTGASFSYTITTSGGSGSVTGSGTISGISHTVTGVDVSNLPSGTLTLSVTVSSPAGGTGSARTATATPTVTGVLDGLPVSAAAFAFRRLASSYSGPLVRVRRASDNAQKDLGATVGGGLDTAALAAFCGASSCFVTTWYDQSGNARHALQATTTAQPRLYNGSAAETEGGRPALRFTAEGLSLNFAAISGQTVDATINAVARVTDTTSNRHIISDRSTGGGRFIRGAVLGSSYVMGNAAATNLTVAGSTIQQRIVTMVSGPTTSMTGVLDGVVTATGTTFFAESGLPFCIGGRSSPGDFIGTISELVIFMSSLSTSSRQVLERSQGAYFGITVP
jgi:hypothetical protein